jgi:hypothetical protein
MRLCYCDVDTIVKSSGNIRYRDTAITICRKCPDFETNLSVRPHQIIYEFCWRLEVSFKAISFEANCHNY